MQPDDLPDLCYFEMDIDPCECPTTLSFNLDTIVDTHEPGREELETESIPVLFRISDYVPAKFAPLAATTPKDVRLLSTTPWVRGLGKFDLTVATEAWKFPAPPVDVLPPKPSAEPKPIEPIKLDEPIDPKKLPIRARPTHDTVLFKDRLLYLLQPPLDSLFDGRQLEVPFEPFPYQLEGIAFLMPRHAALLADEMGLGKTMQTILTLRLLFHQGIARKVLLVCPKPLVHNWSREIKMWAPEVPFEVFEGDNEQRRRTWFVSNCPLKLINYEALTRDADIAADPRTYFDVVIIDEAQRIKNKSSKTAEAVCSIRRTKSSSARWSPAQGC